MAFTVHVPVDTNTPGIVTKIEQQIDLKALPTDQFTRVLNAAKAGVTNGDGYIASLLRRIAEADNIMPPVVISKSDWQGIRVKHPLLSHKDMAEHRDDLIKLSDVRYQMEMARSGKKLSPWERERKSEFYDRGGGYTPSLSLVGWGKSTAPLKKEIQKRVCSHPRFKEDQQKLIAAVMAKPVISTIKKVK